ncbi:MAG TPA: hypothetical protein VGM11_08905 [Acidobacteriaceae bacterium]|jgi:hypothetical protein
MTRHEQGNRVGWASVAASAILWIFGLVLGETKWLPPDSVVLPIASVLSVLSFVLPIIAARKASKLWLLMLLSPIVGYIVVLAHTCG